MKAQRLFIALASSCSFVQAVLDSYPLFNGGNTYWLEALKTQAVPSYSYTKRAWGTAPETCVADAINHQFCSQYNIEVYEITYSDCALPWTICRCSNAPMTIDTIIKNVGRLPGRARQWVRHYSFYAPSKVYPYKNFAAFSTFTDINVFGNYTDSTLLWHETGHNLDFWQAGSGTIYSAGAAWQKLATADTCIVTQYAKSSWQEDFAEVSVSATFEENIGPVPIGTQCWANQLTQSRAILRPAIKNVAGAQCNNRLSESLDVCMGADARSAGSCSGYPDITLKRSVVLPENQPRAIDEASSSAARYAVHDGIRVWDTSLAKGLPIVVRGHEAQYTSDKRLERRFASKVFEA